MNSGYSGYQIKYMISKIESYPHHRHYLRSLIYILVYISLITFYIL